MLGRPVATWRRGMPEIATLGKFFFLPFKGFGGRKICRKVIRRYTNERNKAPREASLMLIISERQLRVCNPIAEKFLACWKASASIWA